MKPFEFDLQLFAQSPSFNLTATGLYKETTFGVPGTPTIWLSVADITMTGTNELLERASARNQIGQEQAETGAFGGAGSMTIESDPDVISKILTFAMGTESILLNTTANNPATTTATTIATPAPVAGATTFNVASGTGILAGALWTINDYNQEIINVASVAANVVTLSSPLKYNHAIGAPVALTAAYDHTLTFGIPRPTFTVQFNRISDCVAFSGNKIGSVDITLTPRQLVQVRLGTTYATEATASAGTPAFSILRPLRVIDPANTVTVNGVTPLAAVLSASISLNTGLQPSEYVIGQGRVIANIPEGQARVTGQFTVQFSNPQFQQLFWGAAGSTGPQTNVAGVNLALNIKSPSYVNGVVQYGVQLILANATLTSVPTAGRSGSPLQQTISFTGYQSVPGANDDLKIICTNAFSVAS